MLLYQFITENKRVQINSFWCRNIVGNNFKKAALKKNYSMIFESYFLGRLFVVPVLSVIRCDASSQSLWCKAAAVQDPERTNDQEVNDTRTFSSLLVKMSQIYMRQIHAVRREDPPPPHTHTHTHTHTHASGSPLSFWISAINLVGQQKSCFQIVVGL